MGRKNKKAQRTRKKPEDAIGVFVTKSSFKNDPFGSYTGRPKNKDEKPVQDADDL